MSEPNAEPGQVWADDDKRAAGRLLRVMVIADGVAECTIPATAITPCRAGGDTISAGRQDGPRSA
jgi:hypothetical protein